MNRKKTFFLLIGIISVMVVLFVGQSKANILVKSTPLQMEPEKVRLSPIPLDLDKEEK
jgi:hypothetical protein